MAGTRTLASIGLFVAAYSLLLPGLYATLFTAKAEFFGMTVLEMEKSTIGTVRLLLEAGRWLPAGIILVFSIIMPFVKLVVVLAYAALQYQAGNTQSGSESRLLSLGPALWPQRHDCIISMRTFLQRSSKWATVDVFAAVLFVGCFSGKPALQVQLHTGFYCFLGYCIFGVLGSLSLAPTLACSEKDEEEQSLLARRPDSPTRPHHPAATMVISALAIIGLGALAYEGSIIRMNLKMLGLQTELSIESLVVNLWTYNSRLAASAVLVLVLVFPAASIIATIMQWGGCRVNAALKLCFEELAMLDVFALALFVVLLALQGLNDQLSGELMPAGRILLALFCLHITVQVAARLRSSPYTEKVQQQRNAFREKYSA